MEGDKEVGTKRNSQENGGGMVAPAERKRIKEFVDRELTPRIHDFHQRAFLEGMEAVMEIRR